MAPRVIPIEVHLSKSDQSIIAVVPSRVHVPHDPNRQVRLEWRATGGALFPKDAVDWEGVEPTRREESRDQEPKSVWCDDPWRPAVFNGEGATVIMSEVYKNACSSPAPLNWPYTIRIGHESRSVTVTIDPEVANDPPGGP